MITTLFRYREQGRFQLHGFVIMPDHIHALITPAHNQTIERGVQLIKGGFSLPSAKNFQERSGKTATTLTASLVWMTFTTSSTTSPIIPRERISTITHTSTPATPPTST